VVRIQAGRLRRSLELYYTHEGKDDSIHIVIPKGTYVPLFLPKHPDAVPDKAVGETKFESVDIIRPLIAVLPFHNLTGDPDCAVSTAMLGSMHFAAFALDDTGSEHGLDMAGKLVQRYVKEDPLVEHIIEGLQKAGLETINSKH